MVDGPEHSLHCPKNENHPLVFYKKPAYNKFKLRILKPKKLTSSEFFTEFKNFGQIFDFHHIKPENPLRNLQILKIVKNLLRISCCKNHNLLKKFQSTKFS